MCLRSVCLLQMGNPTTTIVIRGIILMPERMDCIDNNLLINKNVILPKLGGIFGGLRFQIS